MLNIVLNVLCQIVFTMSYYNALCQIIVYNVLFQALAKYSQIVLCQILLIMLYSKYCSQCLIMNIVHNIFFMSNIVHNAFFQTLFTMPCFTMSYVKIVHNVLCQIIVHNVLDKNFYITPYVKYCSQCLVSSTGIVHNVLCQTLFIMLYIKYCSQCLMSNIVHNKIIR